jgi:stringent starvation protein B
MQPPPPKKEVALALLERSSVHLHLDPRVDGAVVPPWFKKQPQLVLQVGLNMPVPIPDLRLDEDGLSCTLSFNRSPFFCVVPWKSVFAIVGDDGRGMVWPDDVPPEVAQQSGRAASSARGEPGAPAEGPSAARRGPEPALRAAPSGPASNPEATPSSKGKRPRKKPQLVAAPEPSKRDAEPASPPPRIAPAPAEAAPSPRASSPRAPSPLRQGQGQGQGQGHGQGHGQGAGAPTKKPKRELPPYLRVVK